MSMKDMKRSDWHRVLQKDYRARECQVNGFDGRECLTVLRKLTGPLTVHYDVMDVLIADTDYAWLQIALRDQYFWLTAMYDAKGELIQIYIDITNGNRFDEEENPCFQDMYLDIVVTKTREIHVVDQDELDEALKTGAVTKKEYDRAKRVCRQLVEYLTQNKESVIGYCNRAFKELKGLIDQGGYCI